MNNMDNKCSDERAAIIFQWLSGWQTAAAQIRETGKVDMAAEFPRKWRIDLVVDSVAIKDPMKQQAYDAVVVSNEVFQLSWDDFRNRARRTNEAFLQARDNAAVAAKAIQGSGS